MDIATLKRGPNGDLIDRSVIRVGRSFTVNWAFLNEEPSCFVYEVTDKHLRTVYVGITRNFAARWTEHLQTSWWARSVDIDSVLLRGYRTRFEARVVEALVIEEEHPPCNTRPESKYLAIARKMPRPDDVLTAALIPARRF